MANSYLNRTPGAETTAGRKTWTYSVWLKRSKLGSSQNFLWANQDGSNYERYMFDTNDKIYMAGVASGSTAWEMTTTRVFRDSSAWYHIMIVRDTTQGTASNRLKLYVNGTQETAFGTNTPPAQDYTGFINSTNQHNIGRGASSEYFDGYISHAAFVDSAALAQTVFGETDSTSGIWKFKSPSGVTWGTNGFHLKFENSGALGTDSSGNSNTFTVNGNLKQALTTPTNVYATLNPIGFQSADNGQLSNGSNTFSSADSGLHNLTLSNLAVDTGKWYWEVKVAGTVNNYTYIGIRDIDSNPTKNQYLGEVTGGVSLRSDGYYNVDGSFPSQFAGISYGSGDIIGVALDLDNNKIYWYENGTLVNSGGTTVTNRLYAPGASMVGNNGISHFNFGNGFFGTTAITSAGSNGNGSLFEYDVPSGYYALNTKNINTYG